MDELTNLLTFTVTLSVGWLAYAIVLRKSLFSAAAIYWLAWIGLTLASLVCVLNNWMNVDPVAIEYIWNMQVFAFAGFVAADTIPYKRIHEHQYSRLVLVSTNVIKRASTAFLIALFFVGLIFFISRASQVGLDQDYLAKARTGYNADALGEGSVLVRIGSHLSVMCNLLVILLGVVDSHEGISIKKLARFILAAAPLGLGNGGRIYLLSYPLLYFISVAVCRSCYSGSGVSGIFNLKRVEIVQIIVLFSTILTVFSIMGFWRGGYGDQFNVLYGILIWPASTLGVMDTWINVAISNGGTYPGLSFGFLRDTIAHLLGSTESVQSIMTKAAFAYNGGYTSAMVVPRSILPDLVYDFGVQGYIAAMGITAFSLQFLYRFCTSKGIFGHVIAVECVMCAFQSIQNSIFAPGTVVTIFWAAVLSVAIASKSTLQVIDRA